jgi:hypothetical protein
MEHQSLKAFPGHGSQRGQWSRMLRSVSIASLHETLNENGIRHGIQLSISSFSLFHIFISGFNHFISPKIRCFLGENSIDEHHEYL